MPSTFYAGNWYPRVALSVDVMLSYRLLVDGFGACEIDLISTVAAMVVIVGPS